MLIIFFEPSQKDNSNNLCLFGYDKNRFILLRFHQNQNKMEIDLLHPTAEQEKEKHKLKRLVQVPNSYFMDVKCPGCYSLVTAFSHSQTVITCEGCQTLLCTPTGGKCKLTVGSSFRRKDKPIN